MSMTKAQIEALSTTIAAAVTEGLLSFEGLLSAQVTAEMTAKPKAPKVDEPAKGKWLPGTRVEKTNKKTGETHLAVEPPEDMPVGTRRYGRATDKPNVKAHYYVLVETEKGTRYWAFDKDSQTK